MLAFGCPTRPLTLKMWQHPADLHPALQLIVVGLACVAVLTLLRTLIFDKSRRLAFPLPPGPNTLWFSPGDR